MSAALLLLAIGIASTACTATSIPDCIPVTLRLRSTATDAEIEHALMERSTSSSPLFRSHMSIDEVRSLFAAPPHVLLELQRRFPESSVSVTMDSVFIVKCNWDKATALSLYAYPTARSKVVIDVASIVGSDLAPHVRAAFATVNRDLVRPDREAFKLASTFPGVNQNPNTLRQRYSIPNSTLPPAANGTISAQAVAEFEGEQFVYGNMIAFAHRYGDSDLVNVSILGPNSGGYFGEGNLDLEYIMTLAQGSPTWWVELAEFDMTAWVEQFITISPMPSVASISWGSGSSGFQPSDMDSDTLHFQKLGLLGVTVLAASGDVGTGSTGFFSCGTFDSNWPASSPFVTAVGATYSTQQYGGIEVGWSGSGGGFSAFFSRPSWQETAVTGYLSNSTNVTFPSQQFWNRTGRGVPDVSALGTNFETYSYGWGTETGTSAATPTFAAIITRINAERVANRKPTLGFINPRLYELGSVGFDVVEGDNRNPSCPAGFQATKGWDPVSGLGTPNFAFLNAKL